MRVFSNAIEGAHRGSKDQKASKELQQVREELQQAREDLQVAQEAAKRSQEDLVVTRMELRDSKTEQGRLKLALEQAEGKAHRHRTDVAVHEPPALSRQLADAQSSLQRRKKELKESVGAVATLESDCDRLRANVHHLSETVSQKDSQIANLKRDNDALREQLRTARKPKTRDEPSTDVFNHRLDQVSEADLKSGVESLNDSLDTLVMDIIEQGDQLSANYSSLIPNFPRQRSPERSEPPLARALAQPGLTPENRGLLLDALLHDWLHCELFEQLFSGEVASSRVDPSGLFDKTIVEMTTRETWTVVQRWRALTATSLFKTRGQPHSADTFSAQAEKITDFLACAYGLSSSAEKCKHLADTIRPRLLAIYHEATQLCIKVRRDVLSVRMSVVSLTSATFEPAYAESVWPEMGAAAGEEVVGRYKFGLIKRDEGGKVSYLIKPQVATTALIRETSNDS